MNFGNIGFMELMVILVIVLVLFGARRVPEIGASIGKGIREFKKNINDADQQIREPIRDALNDSRSSDRLPTGEANHSSAPGRRGGASGAQAVDVVAGRAAPRGAARLKSRRSGPRLNNMSTRRSAPGRRQSSWRVLRWLSACSAIVSGAAVACLGPTDPGKMGVPVIGSWNYVATQGSPSAAQLNGALAFSGQTGAQISGTLDVVEIGLGGQQRRLAGPVSGRTVDSTTLDFDMLLGGVSRRHVGQVRGDSLTGTWVETPLDGGPAVGERELPGVEVSLGRARCA